MPDPAQAVETALDGSVAAAGGAGTLVLGWFAWIIKRAFSITIPRLSHEFKEALAEQRSDFRDELRQARIDFKDEIKTDRAELGARLDKLTTAIERMDQTLRSNGK